MTIADFSRQEILDLSRETTLYEWTAQSAMKPMVVDRANPRTFIASPAVNTPASQA